VYFSIFLASSCVFNGRMCIFWPIFIFYWYFVTHFLMSLLYFILPAHSKNKHMNEMFTLHLLITKPSLTHSSSHSSIRRTFRSISRTFRSIRRTFGLEKTFRVASGLQNVIMLSAYLKCNANEAFQLTTCKKPLVKNVFEMKKAGGACR